MPDPYERQRQRIRRALEIARREWLNVATSLERCGEVGDFDPADFMIGVIDEDVIIRESQKSRTKSVSVYAPTFYPVYLVDNLLKMDELLPERGYRTTAAAYVFIELVDQAVRRLGLRGRFANGFACGYAYCRTGWRIEKGEPEMRDAFYSTFYPTTYYWCQPIGYDWAFHWTSIQERLRIVFDTFRRWQGDENLLASEAPSQARVVPSMV